MNSSFPNRWSFSYLKFTKYVTNIIAEPKYKYGQQEQVTVRNPTSRSNTSIQVHTIRVRQKSKLSSGITALGTDLSIFALCIMGFSRFLANNGRQRNQGRSPSHPHAISNDSKGGKQQVSAESAKLQSS